MDNDKVNDALLQCVADFTNDVTPARFDSKSIKPTGRQVQQHALWMAHEALSFPPEKLEKKMRWLGFIQGVLFTLGLKTIHELKEMNKPDE